MNKGMTQIVKRSLQYAPPSVILGLSLLNLTTVERQFLILILLVWGNVFILLNAWHPQ
jgi:hypothetical protein